MTFLAFLLAAAYRPDRPGNRAAMRRWEWVALVGFYGVMIWLAALAADSGW